MHWGLTELSPQTFGDLQDRALEAATILWMPFRVDQEGCDEDLRLLRAILEASTLKMADVWDTATALERDPDFIRNRRAIEGRLLVKPMLDGTEISELLA